MIFNFLENIDQEGNFKFTPYGTYDLIPHIEELCLSYILLSCMYSYMRWILLIVLILCRLIVFTNVTEVTTSSRSSLSKGALAGIVLGTIVGAVTLSAVVTLLILRAHMRKHPTVSRRRHCEYFMFLILGRLDRCIAIFHCACNCFYSISWLGLLIGPSST